VYPEEQDPSHFQFI